MEDAGNLNIRDKVRFMTEDDYPNSGDRNYPKAEESSGKNSKKRISVLFNKNI